MSKVWDFERSLNQKNLSIQTDFYNLELHHSIGQLLRSAAYHLIEPLLST